MEETSEESISSFSNIYQDFNDSSKFNSVVCLGIVGLLGVWYYYLKSPIHSEEKIGDNEVGREGKIRSKGHFSKRKNNNEEFANDSVIGKKSFSPSEVIPKNLYENIEKINIPSDEEKADENILSSAMLALSIGENHRANGYYQEAIDQYDIILSSFPEDFIIINNKGWCLERQNKKSLALRFYRKALDINPEFITALSNLISLINENNFPEVLYDELDLIKIVDLQILKNPNDANCYNNKGRIYKKQRKFKKAIKYFDKAFLLDEDIDYLINKTACLYLLNKHNKSIILADKILKNENLKKENLNLILRIKAMGICNISTVEKALEFVHFALKKYSVGNVGLAKEFFLEPIVKYCTDRCKFLWKNDSNMAALNFIENACFNIPNNVILLKIKLDILLDLSTSSKEEILAYCNEILKLDNMDIVSLYHKSIVYFNMGRWKESLECHDRIVKITKDCAAYSNKGLVMEAIGEYQEALVCYDTVLRSDKSGIEGITYNNKGVVLIILGRYPEAINCFDESLEINPRQFNSMANKAFTLFCQGQYTESAELAQKVLTYDLVSINTFPTSNEVIAHKTAKNVLGLLSYASKEFEKSNQLFFESEQNILAGRRQRIWVMRSIGFRHLKAYEKSLECSIIILENQTADIPALLQMGHTYFIQEKYPDAIKFYKIALQYSNSNIDILKFLILAESRTPTAIYSDNHFPSQLFPASGNDRAIHTMVKTIISKKASLDHLKQILNTQNINTTNKFHETLLMLAAKKGDVEVTQYLLSQNANIYIVDNCFLSVIDIANTYQQVKVLELLLQKRERISLKLIEEILVECQKYYKGDDLSTADDMMLVDQYASVLSNTNIGSLRAKKGTMLRYYVHLSNEHAICVRGKSLEYWEIENFLSLRVRYLFLLIIQIRAGDILEKKLPCGKALVEEKLKKELWVTLETLRSRRDALIVHMTPKRERETLRQAHAFYIAKTIAKLEEGEEYYYPGGWNGHAIYIAFMAKGDNILIRVDNMGEGCENLHKALDMPTKKNPNILKTKLYPYLVATVLKKEFFDCTPNIILYIKDLHKAKYEYEKSKALNSIYRPDNLYKEQTVNVDINWPLKAPQSSNNCVVYNHDYGLRVRFKDERFYKWYLAQETIMCTAKKPYRITLENSEKSNNLEISSSQISHQNEYLSYNNGVTNFNKQAAFFQPSQNKINSITKKPALPSLFNNQNMKEKNIKKLEPDCIKKPCTLF